MVEPSATNATRATLTVTYDEKASQKKRDRLNNWVKRRARTLRDGMGLEDTFRLSFTGVDALMADGIKGTKKDLSNVDTRSLPLALFVMACTLRNLPLIIIPILCMLFATVVEFAIMAAVATQISIVSFAPSVMMTLTLAVSFDYSLFFCSRYLEARAEGRPPAERVVDVLASAGHTVVISGLTLIACFCSLLCFPSNVLRGVAVSISVGLGCALCFNLTLTPAIFHAIGERLCALQDGLDRLVARRARCGSKQSPSDDLSADLLVDDDDEDRGRPNGWERLARVLWDDRRVAIAVVCAVVALSAPACQYALDMRELADPTLDSPSPSPPEHAYERLERHFGGGAVAPYHVVFEGLGDMLNQSALDAVDDVLYGVLVDKTGAGSPGPLQISSLTRLGGRRLTEDDYRRCDAGDDDGGICPSLEILKAEFLSPSGDVSTCQILIHGNAYSRSGFDWIETARDALRHGDAVKRAGPRGVYLDGVAAQLRDVITRLYASFPVVVLVTLVVVFALLAAAFRSLAVPARSVAALLLTLSFSFGTCVAVYQRADFAHRVSFLSTRGHGKGIAWLAPLICFSIIVGLALDYDVFLLARVHEYRFNRALDDRRALLAAVSRTGTVITSAGLIMSVAFAGLFLSRSVILNQCAWLLTCAVLYDTFVIRTFFMPSLISLSRGFIWWPSTPPAPLESTFLAFDHGQDDDDDTYRAPDPPASDHTVLAAPAVPSTELS